jgi:hypothetical protein
MSGIFLTGHFEELRQPLAEAWKGSCADLVDADITNVTWDAVSDFPSEVAKIKGVSSPVFASKFCHFLVPTVFPVVDNAGMGNRWATYEGYFGQVQEEWRATREGTREELTNLLDRAATRLGEPRTLHFPVVTKIAELCLIGRYHQ